MTMRHGNRGRGPWVPRCMNERVAVVLGAGGAYGWVFHAGVLDGIRRATGLEPDDAALLVGTSAGAAVAAAVRAGIDPLEIADRAARPPTEDDRRLLVAELRAARKTVVPLSPRLLGRAVTSDQRGLVGLAGLLPPGIFPTSWMSAFPGMDQHHEWPDGLWIPAVSAGTGEVVVFGRDRTDVPVHRAAQASSAVPGMFQPHVIDGTAFFDGGTASPTHADLTAEIEPSLVVISSPMTRPGRRLTSGHARRRLAEEVRHLERRGIRVIVVEPDASTGALADGFPRRNGNHAPMIVEQARDLASGAVMQR